MYVEYVGHIFSPCPSPSLLPFLPLPTYLPSLPEGPEGRAIVSVLQDASMGQA